MNPSSSSKRPVPTEISTLFFQLQHITPPPTGFFYSFQLPIRFGDQKVKRSAQLSIQKIKMSISLRVTVAYGGRSVGRATGFDRTMEQYDVNQNVCSNDTEITRL